MKNISGKWIIYSLLSVVVLIAVVVIVANSLSEQPQSDFSLAFFDEVIRDDALPLVAEELELAQAEEKPVVAEIQREPVADTQEDDKMILASRDRAAQQQAVAEDELPFAPDFTLKDIAGNDFKLSDNLGKLTILNFWATWCRPCLMEIPYFVDLYDKYNEQGLQIIGVSLDEGRSRARVEPTVRQYGINYPILVDGRNPAALYATRGSIPTTFFINEEGRVLGMIVGARPKEFFEMVIQKEMLGE